MKKLYITHNGAELAMAWVQLHCVGAAAWMFCMFEQIALRIICVEAGLLAAYMTWVFLFTMSGSRERSEAAAEAASAITNPINKNLTKEA